MKVLLVGSDKVFSIENFYFKYFLELGVTTERFVAQSIFYDYYFGGSILRKIIFKLGLSTIHKKINNLFIEKVKAFKPEIIWVFKGMELTPESLNWCKQQGIKLANYNPDNPFLFTGKGSGNKNITNSISLYDLHFTYNLEIEKQLIEKHNATTELLPFAFDISNELFEECNKVDEIVKTCFLGNPDSMRADFLEKLASQNIEIDVYGNDWEKFVTHKNIRCFKAIYEKEQWKTLRKYRVQINLMRVHNLNSHNMRTFELAGIGGIQVAPSTNEHKLFFEDEKEIFLFNDEIGCAKKINYLLHLNKIEADLIRENARKKAIENKHSYRDRTAQVYESFKKMLHK